MNVVAPVNVVVPETLKLLPNETTPLSVVVVPTAKEDESETAPVKVVVPPTDALFVTVRAFKVVVPDVERAASVVDPVMVRAPNVVVPEFDPEISKPPEPPGTTPEVNNPLPIEPATVKSPAVVSCQTAVAIAAAVGGVPVAMCPSTYPADPDEYAPGTAVVHMPSTVP